ncbi:MAG: RNA polymerase factor sigma-54 [Myxococcales bacterium]|nr:RNA polymerase factor sigma-54 [Myxococcales bacterium]
MELKQQLRLSQQVVMTPQLQQAIKLLQMSRMELLDSVREEMMENPVLEELPESSESKDQRDAGSAAESPEAQSVAETQAGDANERSNNEIDWERYLENHANQAPMPATRRLDNDDLPGIDQTASRSETLTEHLTWQLTMSDFLEDEKRFATLVFGNLDDRGYLRMEGVPPEEVVTRLAAEADLDPEDAEEVLKLIQRFDPIGVATRDLRECLLVQADHFGMDMLVQAIIKDHIPDLEKRNYGAIAKALEFSLEDVYDAAEIITTLEPRPARAFVSEDPQYITPDVYLHKVGDEYFVVSNDDGMPKLRISAFYRSAIMSDNPETKEYVQNKLRSAQWLIRSIDQRRKTIVKVTECIVDKQRDFFERGIAHLKPMILRDVAEAVGMHESTISRVTNNKYLHSPQGIFELKYFFNSGIRRGGNEEDIASESVKQNIKDIIHAEDAHKPLSDQRIVEMLEAQGIVIARRTVAKYREMLGILSSSKRKKYF